MILRVLFIVAALIAGGGANYSAQRDRLRADPRLLERACVLSSCYPATGNLLIGREARLFSTSTCGLNGRERFCIVSHLEDRKKCFWCESTNNTVNVPSLNHRVQNIIYKFHPGTRKKSWWQSENGKENVTVQLDMEAEFHFTHLIIQFKTFRPKAMLVERSFDFGKTWRVYRYFAHNCNEAFPGVPTHSPRSLTEVVCESRYSGVAPSSEGEVIFRVLPPNINVANPYAEEVQNLLRMTNLRINFTKLHTLGDDFLDNRAEIQEKYYYAIYEMTVRGSCSCYGHASRCLPMPGVESKTNMVHGRCECTHNTRGLNCEYCEDFYNDLPWQPAVRRNSNACKKCVCNNHATTCHFDPAVYNKTGKISGGVCDNCQHNTMGINCERCQPKFYRDPSLDIQSAEICKSCDCDPQGTTDQDILCDDENDEANNKTAGRCHCKANVDGARCDRCKDGFWNFLPENPDGCEECTCNALGTINERGCDQGTGNCFCKRHVTGRNCDQCLPEFYGLSDSEDGCSPCDCDWGGSLDRDCDVITGQCKCRPNVAGRRCDQPIQNFFVGPLDSLVIEGESSLCDSQIDDNAIQSQLCHVVIRENFPNSKLTWTGPGFMKIPEGSTLVFIVNNLKKSMHYNVLIRYEPQSSVNWEEATIIVKRPFGVDSDSPCANIRPEDDIIATNLPSVQRSVLVVPAVCLEANKETEIRIYLGRQDGRTSNPRATVLIDSIVLIPSFDDLPFLQQGSPPREEFDRYNCGDPYYYDLSRDNVPEVCRKHHASIGFIIRNGSESCQCDPTGSNSFQCDRYTGKCDCIANIVGARCDRCAPGTYGFSKFGCKRCDCNSIGSLNNFCDAASGQCKCRANTYGRACNLCQPGYFNFPNCQQCDCNGHAVECDDKTGACKECGEYTEGHRCERCIEGYYGDPRLGTDIACRPCHCPGVKGDPDKSSHADKCELDETNEVNCYCKEGYAGPLCDVCADNYFGDPLKGTCEKCECNGNIDVTKPENCDPYTGKCLKCLHNTAGEHCEVCEEGYYGDALEKACYKCNCSVLGTNFTKSHCDGTTGQCPCFPNVIGINCDQCTENHWRIALGTGCDPCECDSIGSVSPQCNPYVGNCDCKPGHGGRQCDQCQENHWGDPNIECHECDCDPYGSALAQCDRVTGACVCKPGMGGYRCDMCARGYLGYAPRCEACGECFDSWDKVINDLRIQTDYAIGNASKIKLVGATGAYTRDFDEMTKKLAEIENVLHSTENGQITIQELLANVTSLSNLVNEAEKRVKDSNDNLNSITSKINLGNVTLDGLRTSIENLKLKTLSLGDNATKLQEANLEGALNLTREAKERALTASDDAENVQQLIANTDRQIKNTDRLIEMQYANFNSTQNENDKKLVDIQDQLLELENQMPKLNEKMCGNAPESDTCDICGGAGCGKCGGISCDQGAVTKAEQALDFANKTEFRIKDHELNAEDLFRSVSQIKQDTVSVRSKAKDLQNKAVEFKTHVERAVNESQDLTQQLKLMSNNSTSPSDVRTLANDILNMSISIEPKEITELSQRINDTVSQLKGIEQIIIQTQPDLDRAKELKINATTVNKSANLTLEMANKVLEALDEAQAAQDAAENAINKANSDIEAAKADLTPIAWETEQAQKKANETKEQVEALRIRLSDLQKDILKIESDAEQVKQEADDVVNRAEGAEENARRLRQEFKQANMSLSERASSTSNSRARAQILLNRATKLASDTQLQLKALATMEELYNDHNEQLNSLENEIGNLNSQMNYYLSEITKRSDNYRSCTTWLYLEPILSNDDGELGSKYRKVDQGFRQVSRILESDPRLSALLQSSRLQPMLDSISEQLLACQSALNQYIDEKRSIFPRLYFLSDDDLLELLGQARAGAEGREAVMQTHLKKLFPGTTGVRLGPGGLSITALCSQYGQTFQLDHPVDIDCPVEMWLKNLETEMRSSLKNMTLKCVVTNSLQEQDPFSLPTQILCLAQNIRFTEQAENAIVSKELHKLKANVEKENLYYASAEVEDENERHKRQALILQCAYYMSVIQTLIDNNVTSTSDWLWQKQLRFYLTNTKEVVAKMGLALISYSYEYLGVNTGQFVRTEFADECFLVLTQALHLGLVGNPFGPAGTGKTESVKALGGLVGRLVLIFNCDEAMDAECMGRLLTGLALSGAWGCFDEFNRLSAATLAAVSHQLASLLPAMQQRRPGSPTATLNGKQVVVSEWCGVAATMNPLGRGYGGRRALPAALERVLRPVAMTQPAPDRLASHLLAARCMRDAARLAQALHVVFLMASNLLSGQRHYDWGLRALKATIGSCSASVGERGESGAKNALRRALRLNSVSKLTHQDAQRFENILSIVFADVPEEETSADTISPALEAAVDTLGIVNNTLQIQKCKELYEQLQQRMGVVIVGPPGSGKTTIRQLLKTALTQQGKTIVEYVICPKAMSRSWLLGHIDHDTRQWTDGVISSTALEISNQPSDVWSWVVCDGDIDPEWIEALNSVLDDNRLLTLPSGWRVQFGANVNFVFETHSLDHASPATVSRMGIILLSDDSSCAPEVIDNWVLKAEYENETAKVAVPLLQTVIKKCLQWLAAHRADTMLKLHSVTVVKQILTQFEYVVQNIGVGAVYITPEEVIYLALQRSIIGLLKENAVDSFQQEMSELLGPAPVDAAGEGGPGAMTWAEGVLLSRRLRAREAAVRAALLSEHAHLLILGPDACAKNLLAEYILKESNSTVITIDCTPILEPADIITELKRHNVIRSSGRNGATKSGRVTLLARALHRARVDAWGSSAVQAVLLQLMQQSGVWVRGGGGDEEGGMQWCGAARVRVLATAGALGPLAPRLAAGFGIVTLQEPEEDELIELARHYLRQSVDKNISEKDVTDLASVALAMFKEVTETFHSRAHYKWNASHLQAWCENVKWYAPSDAAELIVAISSEANMIFKDRLVTEEEKISFYSIARSHLKGTSNDGTYFIPKIRGDGVYLEALDHRDWYQTMQKIINQCLTEHEYNVFGEAGAEVCSELAILCPAMARATNGGIAVCVGSAGLGRRAAAHIVAAALSASLIFVDHHKQFNNHFKNALSTSAEGTRTLLVVSESAADNTVLAAIESHTHAAPTDQLTSHMLENIKQNLGIVICLDKDQENLLELIDKYPLVYNKAHLVWLEHWSAETLRQMPQLVIQRLIKENVSDSDKEQHEAIPVEGFVSVYNSLDSEWMRAPCRYVNLLKSYYHIVSGKKAALVQRQNMLSSGVEALRRARSEVATLQTEAAKQETALSDKQAKANQALDQIGATVRATTDKKEEMHVLKKNIEVENEKLQIRKKEIEEELASVEPIIAAARAAVGDIKPESLSEVRSLRAPPDVVRDVLEGVLRLMGIADTSWHSMKSFLSKRGVKEDIRCLDASQISPESVASVQRLLERRGASFEQATAKRASAACAPLAAWVRANLAYAAALARVQPLQAHQRLLHKNLQEAESQLAALSSGLATVDERVASLKEQLGQHTRDAAAIELSLTNATKTIQAARSLLDQLAHEYAAWETDLENISKEISELTLRSLLAAAYIVYLPDVTEPQAREYVSRWSQLIGFDDPAFSVINFLATTEKQLKWDADGLPLDKTAIKNAILIDQFLGTQKCGFTPLIIDPDGDAMGWLKNTLADVQSEFVSQHNEKLQTSVQYAVRLGRVLVVTEVDSVHPSWHALLSGLPLSSTVAAPPAARLLLYCRDCTLPARLPPASAARLALLHFTARRDGLTDQLVQHALQQQNPEVNEKAKEIKLKKATLQKQQHELQENLLRDLSTNSDILHDANLLASLNKTRATSTVIAESLEVARGVERQARAACEAYAPGASRAALLALAVKSLAAHRPLLALPVDTILDVFVDAIRREPDQKNINNDSLVKYVTRRIVERVLLGLHKKDKYIVVLHLLRQVYDNLVPEKLWNIFVGNFDISEDQGVINDIRNSFAWIPDQCVKKMALLKAASEDLYERLSLDNAELWSDFLDSGDLSALGRLRLSAFETVAAVAVLRPDTLYRAIVVFVDQVLGAGVVTAGEGIARAARWAGCGGRSARPALLLGAHATDVLAAHAHDRALAQVGIEEGMAAWEAAVEKARGGGWVALVVGASPFTPDLQTFLTNFGLRPSQDFSEDFRLWIVSEDREIPPLISNTCVNVILEAPEGVKHNLIGTLSAWGQYEGEPLSVRVHACLALLHALAQERRAYIPQGWSRWYSWEWGEISACTSVIRATGTNTQMARELSLALYSARVGADPDRKLLGALLKDCLGDHAMGHSWKPRGLDIQLPFTKQLQAYSSAFEAMPDMDSPQLLGLPANCRVAWEKNAVTDIQAGLRELSSTVNVHRKSDNSAPLKSLLSLWKKFMSGSPLIKADFIIEKVCGGWWGCVSGGEAAEAARAARLLHHCLAQRARAALPLHKVPEDWQLLWAGPDAPHAYVKEFCFRARAALARLHSAVDDDYMPTELDLRSLLVVERAVWALRVRTAARLACPVAALTLLAKWGADVEEAKATGGMLVTGLWLSGCAWADGALAPVPPRAPPHAPAPPLLLRYVLQSEESSLEPDGTLLVPVYSNAAREQVVLYARAPLARSLRAHTATLHAAAAFIAPLD